MMIENRWRFISLGVMFGLGALIIFSQTIRFQFIPEAKEILRDSIEFYSGRWIEVKPPRGQIYDRWGHLLAGNRIVYEVGLDLLNIEDPESIALALNGALNLDYNEVLQLAKIESSPTEQYYIVANSVSTEQIAVLEQFIEIQENREGNTDSDGSLIGLVLRPHLERSYPENDLASNVLGFVSREGEGYFGVEQYYDNTLTGIPQKVWTPLDPNRVSERPDIPPGASLVLTLDREIQATAERLIDQAVTTYNATAGTIIVMHPKTGEIYAMATTPRLDLNQFWRFAEVYPGATPFNRSVSKSYEPGSVFKIITMAAALNNKTVDLTTIFLDTGSFSIGGIRITNWDNLAYSYQDMLGCLKNSLNVCLAWIASEMGAKDFYSYLNAFGFGGFTGIDLAGEAKGRLKAPGDGDWYPADLGTNSFGQGISVTPIQMMMAASAVANEGKMVVPHIVRSFVDNGNQYDINTQIAGQPISAATARLLSEMLAVSLEDEGAQSLVPGYRLAGKTGTAEIPTPDGYSRSITNASFLGWGPVDDPEFMVYVWLEEPRTSIWGSQTAAPVFAQLVERLVVLLNIPLDPALLEVSGQ